MTEFNRYGLLPPGIHDMSMDEIGLLFGGVAKSPHRSHLFERLEEYVKRLLALRIGVALLVDGSFVMPCVDMPADIDLVLVMPETWETPIEEISKEYYNLVSSTMVTKKSGLHLVAAVAEHSPEYDDWICFFSDIKRVGHWALNIPKNVSKGLVRVTL